MLNKKQILFIHGGETFESQADFYTFLREVDIDPFKKRKKWRDWLAEKLSDNYVCLMPSMPAKENADYEAWKIWFERHLEFLQEENPIIIGSSLGATFIIKYLSENSLEKQLAQLHLIAPVVSDTPPMSLEKMATFEMDISNISKLVNFCDNIHLWASEDDDVVPFENALLVKKQIPTINFHQFKDRGHFSQSEFPELLDAINKLG